MNAADLITLADLKVFLPAAGTGKDPLLRDLITTASRLIEDELGRRLVFRAPAEVSGAANLLAATSWTVGTPAITAQPAGGRALIVTFSAATAGTLTITGTINGVVGATLVVDAAAGLVQHVPSFVTALTGFAIAGAVGGGTVAVGSSLGYVEFHTLTDYVAELLPLEWPIQNILEVNEDWSRGYTTTTQLTEGTHYVVTSDGPEGAILTRVVAGLPSAWARGWRAEKLVLAAGYAGQARVPAQLKQACRELVAILWDRSQKGRIGVSSQSDASGNFTRYAPADLTNEIRAKVMAYRRRRFGAETGVRAYDLEVA